MLSCVIYKITSNYVCIDYLDSESKQLSELGLGYCGCFKHVRKIYDKILGIGIPDLLMNFMSFRGFLKNKDSFIIRNVRKGCLNTISQKEFTYFYCNKNNL